MSVRIRLRRTGSRKRPFYRVVVADSGMPRDGKFIDIVGYYDPRSEGALEIDEEKVRLWEERGAQPTQAAARLIARYRAGGGGVSAAAGEEMPVEIAEGGEEMPVESAEGGEEMPVESAEGGEEPSLETAEDEDAET
ncbi:hypothetical protein AMJ71_06680 [candidate division TA06 bacterium SM1_40]|uniref:Small ribosomal subunit protein bS16 n=2 Tax=Bacteria division TA06 TaxID=1156500 RepID=A0A0S8JKI5_UNCT6|nr:MAG: hypothetical protein AMJ82_01305 [candidate division TA06 bacterium SM23_40]KPL09333.1 MAG: hypothetical protein AMJ71_06680 [candidate division TA06 bacterium SM1_40]